MDTNFKNAIKAHLDERAKIDEQFAVSYAKEGKSIDECCRYILHQMRRRGNAVAASDSEVYGMAVHYYDEDDIKVPKYSPGHSVASNAPSVAIKDLTEEEKAEAREVALATYREQQLQRLREEEKKKASQSRQKRRESEKETAGGQLSLFDL